MEMDLQRVLVVDDEPEIRKLLQEYLQMEHYLVDLAANGKEALEKLTLHVPDIILLDINMPDMDGYRLCSHIREYVSCPILFLTARTQEGDRVKGFQCGGDDYILKPFGMEELIARIEAHLRREHRKQQMSEVYLTKKLVVDFSGKRIVKEGVEVELTKTEFGIVELLVMNQGRVFDKETIYERVRGYDSDADSGIITEHIRRIRKKLGQENGRDYIETVWGVGYKWIG